MKNELTIGVLGGMGTYATINLFNQYAEVFRAEKEWDRPRIIIDNRCTMPSRVRAFLYGEKLNELVNEISDSLKSLINAGASRIILACNTSHLFLEKVYEKHPEFEPKVVNIVKETADRVAKDNVKRVYILGSEATIDSALYQNALKRNGVKSAVPDTSEYPALRYCIEAVKQNKYDESVQKTFSALINGSCDCILGCTELPVLYDKYRDKIKARCYDPLRIALEKLYAEYIDE